MTVKKSKPIWYECRVDDQTPGGQVHARIRVPADSPWFDGHFPDNPLLPGVAQLGMVHDLLCRTSGRPWAVDQVSRVRFKQMIRPDQVLTLTIRPADSPDSHSFRISGDEGLVCSGLIRVTSADAFGKGDSSDMAVETDAIILRIAEIMINELKLEDVTPDTFDPDIDLVDEVGIDSMDLATVALVLRDEYAVRIDEDDYPKLTTVRLIGEYIQKKLAA